MKGVYVVCVCVEMRGRWVEVVHDDVYVYVCWEREYVIVCGCDCVWMCCERVCDCEWVW